MYLCITAVSSFSGDNSKQMKNNVFVFFAGLIFLFAVQSVWAQPSVQQQKDSLRRVIAATAGEEKLGAYKRLASFYMREVRGEGAIDTLFAIYDALEAEAIRQGNVDEQAAARTNRLTALANKLLFHEVISQAPACLDFLAGKEAWKFYYQAYSILITSYRGIGDYDGALREAQTMYDRAKKQKDNGGMGVALYGMSRIYNGQRRFADQERCLRESIALLEKDEGYINSLASAYDGLVQNLIAQKRYTEALQAAAATEEVNRRYETLAKAPTPGAWINLWMSYSDVYLQTGAYDKAEMYMNKVDSISNNSVRQFEGRAQVSAARGEYENALGQIDKAIEFARNKRQPKGVKLFILMDAGKAEQAKELFVDIVAELDSLRNLDFTTRLDEIRTQYEVEKHIAGKQRNRNYFLFALGGCLLLVTALGVWMYYSRKILQKNRIMARQIKELNLQRDRYMEEILLRGAIESGEEAEDSFPPENRLDKLCAAIHNLVLKDRIYRNPAVSREQIIEQLGTNRQLFDEAVQTCFGMSFTDYIASLRMKDAVTLLEKSDLPIEIVAEKAGYGTLRTLQRQFYKQYGMSPKDYRKSLNGK
jgi:AraC-like DNA-binding protein/Flp pilus assembly protein TadD